MFSNVIVCNSSSTLQSLPASVRSRKGKIVYNGVNFEKIDRQKDKNHHESKLLRIGTICRLVDQKDLPTLIRSFCEFERLPDVPPSELVIVGDGPERQKLERMVAESGLGKSVRFTGNLTRIEAYRELHMIDIFVVSSWTEGFCNSMVEAAAAGKPVVASDIPTLVEIIGSENALFFSVRDDQDLLSKLGLLARDSEYRRSLGAKASTHVRGRFSLAVSVENYANVYRMLLRHTDPNQTHDQD